MSDLVLIAFVACAICLMTCGVCNFLWERARDEAGDDRVGLGLESEPRLSSGAEKCTTFRRRKVHHGVGF
jgi:hypothetical protein